jgi:CBS domain-containing protein
MNVAAILKGKGRAVTTARPDATLHDIARELTAKRIGAIVLLDSHDRVAGIISERDIVRAVARSGPECLIDPVHRHMTREVVTCLESDTLDEIMATMTSGRFRHVPVVEGGKLVGIVSIGDVVKHHIAEVEMEASALRGYIVAG